MRESEGKICCGRKSSWTRVSLYRKKWGVEAVLATHDESHAWSHA